MYFLYPALPSSSTHSVLSSPSFSPLHHFFTLNVQPPFLFVCRSYLLFCGGRAAAVSQPLLLAPAGATGLPITSPAAEISVLPLLLLLLLPLFVIHCVVTLIIMDSAQVFRLSAGSWSPHITLSSTCTQTCAGMHTYMSWANLCTLGYTCALAHMDANSQMQYTPTEV